MRNQRRGRRFAVRSGDRNYPWHDVKIVPLVPAERSEEQPYIIVDLHPFGIGSGNMRIGRRVKMRNAGAGDKRLKPFNTALGEIRQNKPRVSGNLACGVGIVPTHDLSPARAQRMCRAQARSPKSEDSDLSAPISFDRYQE